MAHGAFPVISAQMHTNPKGHVPNHVLYFYMLPWGYHSCHRWWCDILIYYLAGLKWSFIKLVCCVQIQQFNVHIPVFEPQPVKMM